MENFGQYCLNLFIYLFIIYLFIYVFIYLFVYLFRGEMILLCMQITRTVYSGIVIIIKYILALLSNILFLLSMLFQDTISWLSRGGDTHSYIVAYTNMLHSTTAGEQCSPEL